jgi:hypothetical protein
MSQWLEWKSTGTLVDRPTVNFAGIWKNELGSQMDLAINGTQVTGTYSTAVGGPNPTDKFPVIGFVNGDIIGFTVNWGDEGSITCWVGEFITKAGVEKIETMWHLVENVDRTGQTNNAWAAFLAGSDTFTR